MGRFGQKTGGGWYDYEPGSRTPITNAEVEALIVATSREMEIERRMIGEQEILERCVYPLINEGARILDEGIALRPGDIDIIWLNGYGFPPFRGGPMFYGDTVGLGDVLAAVQHYASAHGDLWAPSPLLERLAGEGKGFADWSAG
jgi:3-hydroxyacyl-CoA dehydrogenase